MAFEGLWVHVPAKQPSPESQGARPPLPRPHAVLERGRAQGLAGPGGRVGGLLGRSHLAVPSSHCGFGVGHLEAACPETAGLGGLEPTLQPRVEVRTPLPE